MTLDELATLAPAQAPLRVPAWALGAFRRRSITYFTGACDVSTRVIWLQSHGLSADLRLPADFPAMSEPPIFAQLSEEVLMALAKAEGGLAETSWDGALMRWSNWTALQLHDKWPEPGQLRRVGDCLVEFAPSGAYVEDWRLQPSVPGLLAGLKLIEERDLSRQEVRHRGGGLIVCGEYACLVRGRPEPVTAESLPDAVRSARGHESALRALFAFECSYAERDGMGAFKIALSTRPWRANERLAMDGFSYDAGSGLAIQHLTEDGIALERRFSVDVLRPGFTSGLQTQATDNARAWLLRERTG